MSCFDRGIDRLALSGVRMTVVCAVFDLPLSLVAHDVIFFASHVLDPFSWTPLCRKMLFRLSLFQTKDHTSCGALTRDNEQKFIFSGVVAGKKDVKSDLWWVIPPHHRVPQQGPGSPAQFPPSGGASLCLKQAAPTKIP